MKLASRCSAINSSAISSSAIKRTVFCAVSLIGGISGITTSNIAQAQNKPNTTLLEEVIVTAQRREESLQEVPISITVFNQEQIDDRQVTDVQDLAAYVPGLSVDSIFGSGLGSFSIRGFTREARTTAAVAVYFADAVAPRGNTSQYSGDGAGPGSFFDLANVQVLRGPQGTLFGRNTTGGAVLLVPKKPTDQLEGYAMVGAGNYSMKRAQGVLNLPVSDSVRLRFGLDSQERDGFIDNLSDLGPREFNEVDYISFRASMVIDITDKIENYTVATVQESDTVGDLVTMYGIGNAAGSNAVVGGAIQAQADSFEAADNFYAGSSGINNPTSQIEQRRLINTTLFDVSENFSVKNIASYSELETTLVAAIFGSDFLIGPGFGPATGTHAIAAASYAPPGGSTTDSSSWSEEIQLLGQGDNYKWQAGLYYEETNNEGLQGSMSPTFVDCGDDVRDLNCFDSFGYTIAPFLASIGAVPPGTPYIPGRGALNATPTYVEYENFGAYAQGTYDFSEALALTMGVRYTDDKVNSFSQAVGFSYGPTPGFNAPVAVACQSGAHPNQIPVGFSPELSAILDTDYCVTKLDNSSDAVTWLINLDYKPADNMLVYGKYTRGYRQGSINPAAPVGVEKFEPEQVDTYEFGVKTEFESPVPTRLNAAVFYNDFTDQQIAIGHPTLPGASVPNTSSIANAGKSVIQGMELEASIFPTESLRFDLSYGYLDTELKELTDVANPDPTNYSAPLPQGIEGGDLPRSPKHKASLTGTYTLPLSPELGDLSLGATYTYTSEMVSGVSTPPLESNELLNLNANWRAVAGSQFDLALFVTNATDEEYITFQGSQSLGSNRRVGPPRMYGMSLRYNFGS